ncbi:hypothetical protein PAPYR_3394 [Paratrimastix pyriformis]|uniref:Uncharacterized protein n=1 Tax=Paratrimastix pyriformis TaxID=342808 RepID=A0ABQ8UMH3_9EUKA|nr:hypothetical protein PAPYR_3394 [Paratrimastix pyriformis]
MPVFGQFPARNFLACPPHGLKKLHGLSCPLSSTETQTKSAFSTIRRFFYCSFCSFLCMKECNLSVTNVFTFMMILAEGVFSGQWATQWIYLLRHSEHDIGFTSLLSGVVEVAIAFPASFFADKWGKPQMLWIASLVGLISLAINAVAVIFTSIELTYASVAAWAVFTAIHTPSIEALFSDTISARFPGQDSSKHFSRWWALSNIASAIGTVVPVPLFLMLGDAWELPVLRITLGIGFALALPPILCLLFFRRPSPPQPLDEEEICPPPSGSTVESQATSLATTPSASTTIVIPEISSPAPAALTPASQTRLVHSPESPESEIELHIHTDEPPVSGAPEEEQQTEGIEEGDEEATEPGSPTLRHRTPAQQLAEEIAEPPAPVTSGGDSTVVVHTESQAGKEDEAPTEGTPPAAPESEAPKYSLCVPFSLAAAELAMAMSTGICGPYFSVYMSEDLLMGPVAVALVYCGGSVGATLLSLVTPLLARRLGRAATVLLLQLAGVGFQLLATLSKGYLGGSWILFSLAFALRYVFFNATGALTNSLLMDSVPPQQKTRWSILQNIDSLTWAASSELGAVMLGSLTYEQLFLICTGLLFVANLPWIFVIISTRSPACPVASKEVTVQEEEEAAEEEVAPADESLFDGALASVDAFSAKGLVPVDVAHHPAADRPPEKRIVLYRAPVASLIVFSPMTLTLVQPSSPIAAAMEASSGSGSESTEEESDPEQADRKGPTTPHLSPPAHRGGHRHHSRSFSFSLEFFLDKSSFSGFHCSLNELQLSRERFMWLQAHICL